MNYCTFQGVSHELKLNKAVYCNSKIRFIQLWKSDIYVKITLPKISLFHVCFSYILLVQMNYLVLPYMEMETETANGLDWFSVTQIKNTHFSGKPTLAIRDKFWNYTF